MSAASAMRYRNSHRERNGYNMTVMLSADVNAQLQALCDHHRMTRREVVSRLILGQPLGGHGGSEQELLGMSNDEYKAFEELRRQQ